MKVLAINSGRKNGNTYQLLVQIQCILSEEKIDLEIINLHDYNILPCIGCEVCLLKGNCNRKDDVETIKNKIIDSDALILASPVYLRSISGILKTFVDRTCTWYHRPVLYGKPILSVSTTKGSGLKYTLRYLEDIGVQWGMLPSGKIGRSIINIHKPIDPRECRLFIKNIRLTKIEHRPPFKSIIEFNVQKALSNANIQLDAEYWLKKGWDKSNYFYRCKINIFKRLCGSFIFLLLNQIMNKE